MKGPYFEGDLVQNETLDKVARQRQKTYHELTVPFSEKHSYIEQGWEEKKSYKRSVRLQKAKSIDELLEDEVWLLFKNMGFTEMNKDRSLKIRAGVVLKQIDVFASDETDAFVVECKTSFKGAKISQEDILGIASLKQEIADSVRKHYANRAMRVSFVMATQNIDWSKSVVALAKSKQVFVWREEELEYYRQLLKQLGPSAKFQIYSILFRHKKIPQLRDIRVPAICGGRGKGKYYCFVIQPEKLLQIAYVHHREATLKDIVDSYQRMLVRKRLDEINRFISSEGGYFRNNIIINFTKSPTFERKETVGDIVYGILEFPPYYSSAWIIDGQHRLYGYKDSEKKSTHTIPVVAFVHLEAREQAKLFVQINEKQKPVPSNLLWDLYPDIYHDSDEPGDQLLRTISLVVKKLNSDSDSPLRDHIRIPSVVPKGGGITNLTMATVCESLEESKLLDAEGGLLYKEDYDSTVVFAAERLQAYFNLLAKAYSQDWAKGNKGLLRTNIGIRILLIIFKQILLYFRNLGEDTIYRRSDLSEFQVRSEELLRPMLVQLDEMGEAGRNAIREQSTKGLVVENAKIMAWEIQQKFKHFGVELLKGWARPVPSGVTDEDIRALLQDTETSLRTFLARELKNYYGAPWWRQGIPDGVKKAVNMKIEDEAAKTPYRREELRSLTPDRRISFIDTPHIREIIEYRSNWERFRQVFVEDKDYTSTHFKSFERIRHKYQHFCEHELDEISKNLGYWGMRWIRKCIGLNQV